MTILDITSPPVQDDSIVRFEAFAHSPYASTTYGRADEVRIPVQQQDLYVLPCQSVLHIEGRLTAKNAAGASVKAPKLTNNFAAFLFDEIRYELNGVEIDRSKNVGVSTLLKNYVSLSPGDENLLANAGWDESGTEAHATNGDFDVCVPLAKLLGFAEDYRRVIANARHELVLIRARNDDNVAQTDAQTTVDVQIIKIKWVLHHVTPSDTEKLQLLSVLESGRNIPMSFRSWDLYEIPQLPQTQRHTWAIKTSVQLEKPRYVVLAFQTARRNVPGADASRFDDCNLTDAKLYLNSDSYPYDAMNLEFAVNRYALLYEAYANFQRSYYGRKTGRPLLSPAEFKLRAPIVVLDASRQNEALKSAPVDCRIEFQLEKNAPADTTAYALVIHDRVVEYNPLTNIVRKHV